MAYSWRRLLLYPVVHRSVREGEGEGEREMRFELGRRAISQENRWGYTTFTFCSSTFGDFFLQFLNRPN